MGKISVEDIPLEAITAARDAMADEYLSKKITLEQSSFVIRLHKKRITERILKIGRYLSQLDDWIKEIRR